MTRSIRLAGLLSLLHVASAQNIAPTDTTAAAGSGSNGTEVGVFHGNTFISRFPIRPLRNGTSIPEGGVRGNFTIATPDTQLGIQRTDVVLISCDPYMGNLQPSSVFDYALDQDPVAVVLYSTDRGSCELSGPETAYDRIYTMQSTANSSRIEEAAVGDSAMAIVGSSETVANASMTRTETNGSDSGGERQSNNNNMNSFGPSPSTAVAMIILYSITGIITALFLVIIITGAVRAHRHPERYGPRNIIGRPRQSRARGLARAMLETLPIVRFGESQEEGHNKPTDVELAEGPGQVEINPSQESTHQTSDTTKDGTQSNSHGSVAAISGIAAATERSNSAPIENQGCSICTEDFAVGEDLRVLPCDHRYHPACIDPWLLNVSGTCPLCRIDLRPQAADDEVDEAGNPIGREGDEMVPPLDGDYQRSSIRRSLMIGLTGISRPERLTREERVAAIRRYTEEQRAARAGEGGVVDPVEDESSMRSRLRNRFRVRTRRAGTDGQVQEVIDAPAANSESEANATTLRTQS